jgi:hypothetical protein
MVNNMDDKRADNKVLEKKVKIKEIDSKIDIEKNKEKRLDDIEEIVTSLNNNINRCLELLSISIKGNNSEKKYNNIQTENRINYKKNMNDIEIQREMLKTNINKLNTEKEGLLKEEKEEE